MATLHREVSHEESSEKFIKGENTKDSLRLLRLHSYLQVVRPNRSKRVVCLTSESTVSNLQAFGGVGNTLNYPQSSPTSWDILNMLLEHISSFKFI